MLASLLALSLLAPCDTSYISVPGSPSVIHTEASIDVQQDGGRIAYDRETGELFSKTVWPGMYAASLDARNSYLIVGPASVDPIQVTASIHLLGYSIGECPPHSTCEPGYASMGLLSPTGSFLAGTNVIHGWQYNQDINQTASCQANFVPGTSFDLKLNLQTGANNVTITNGQVTFLLPEGYSLETCDGVPFTPPPPGTVDVSRMGATGLALRALGAHPSRGMPAFECTLPADGEASLALVDLRGRILYKENLGHMTAGPHHVSITSSLPPGVYWARLSFAGALAQKKVVLVSRP